MGYFSHFRNASTTAHGGETPKHFELRGEATQQHQDGCLREPILISDNGTVHNEQGDVLNLAFMCSVPQGDKDRACDDLRHSITNRAAAALTPVRLVSWGHLAAISNRFLAKGAICEFPQCDHKSSYNALPVDPRETRFAVITSKCPKEGNYFAFIIRTLLFGSIASVLRYNVFARIVTDRFWHPDGIFFRRLRSSNPHHLSRKLPKNSENFATYYYSSWKGGNINLPICSFSRDLRIAPIEWKQM